MNERANASGPPRAARDPGAPASEGATGDGATAPPGSRSTHAVLATVADQPGMLYRLSKVFAEQEINITNVDLRHGGDPAQIYFEFSIGAAGFEALLEELRRVPGVHRIEETPSLTRVYGKRVIVMGGGAQVGQVALGAITEADRHNIRGEHISIDTIPLVGEQELADAVRAVMRLPRVRLLVLAGSIMGGAITDAVEEVRRHGLPVISLNMVGTVPDAADLVVTDPVQAGVMAVMAVADTAKFDLMRQLKRKY